MREFPAPPPDPVPLAGAALAAEFTRYLHQHIPLTAALGAELRRAEPGLIELAAPLEPNLNHRNTAFGGSLAALGILSGWALLHLGLRADGVKARIVVQKSEAEFIAPGEAELIAVSRRDEDEWRRFVNSLRRGRRARIAVATEISAAGACILRHTGIYAALP